MKEEDAFAFLVKVAIPEVTDQSCIPDNEDLSKYFQKLPKKPRERNIKRRSHRIWDAIWRAHRDVLTGFRFKDGRFYANRRLESGPDSNEQINAIALTLFELIVSSDQLLESRNLIYELYKCYNEPEGVHNEAEASLNATTFGAIQKLVNMTLKYLVILQTFEKLEKCVDETKCDCPIDSIILGELANNHPELSNVRWTNIRDFSEYDKIQSAIDQELRMEAPRLMYDFKNWQ